MEREEKKTKQANLKFLSTFLFSPHLHHWLTPSLLPAAGAAAREAAWPSGQCAAHQGAPVLRRHRLGEAAAEADPASFHSARGKQK